VAVVNPQGAIEPTFDLGGLEMELHGWLVEPGREYDVSEDTSFSQKIVLDEDPASIDIYFNHDKQRYEMTGVKEAELFFEDVLSIIPTDYFTRHREFYSYPFSGNFLPDLEKMDPELYHIIKNEFPPKMHFVQHAYNNHRNAQDAYLINYMDAGGRHFQNIVFTFEVNIDHLVAGSYAAELKLDPNNKKYDSGENYPIDITEDITVASSDPDEDPDAPLIITGLYFDELTFYDRCFDHDYSTLAGQAATYVYRVNHQQWPADEEWAHHLKSFLNNGVDDGTADEMAIGEVWGPFGTGCHSYNGDHTSCN